MALEAQAEGIVVGEQVEEGLLQKRGLQRLTRGQEDGLVEVVGVSRIVRQQVLLHGRERHGARDNALLAEARGGALDDLGELRHGLVLEELARGDGEIHLSGAGDHLEADDGVAAEVEEVVVDAHLRDGQDLSPDVTEALLDVVARRDVGGLALLGEGKVREQEEP